MNPPFEEGVTTPWGVKIGPNYYFIPASPTRNYNVFAGIYLKAHKAIAAYIEMTVGVNFGLQKSTPRIEKCSYFLWIDVLDQLIENTISNAILHGFFGIHPVVAIEIFQDFL